MSKKILGLDIRHNTVSAVVVRNSFRGNVIEAHAHLPLSNQKELDDHITDLLESMAKKTDLSDCVCMTTLPADLLSYRNIQVPFAEQKKIRQILPFELEPTLPFSVEDLTIDFHTFNAPNQNDQTNLIAAAIEKQRVNTYLDMLASFNVQPKLVTPSGYPLATCMAGLVDPTENWLFIDIENSKNTYIGLSSGQVCMIRSVTTGKTVPPDVDSLCTDIKQTLAAFQEISLLDFQPDRGFISGNGTESIHPERYMADMTKTLGYPIQQIDLLSHTDITLKGDLDRSWKSHIMDNALALALIEIEGFDSLNFRKSPIIEKKIWMENRKTIIQTGILAGFVLLLGLFFLTTDYYYMKKKITRLDNQAVEIFKATFPEIKASRYPLQQMEVEIKEIKKKSRFSTETKKNIRAIDILAQISSRISQDINTQFTRLVIGDESVLINGNTDTFNSVDDIKSGLEQAEIFKQVTISSANMETSGERVRFKLKVQL